MTQLNLTTPPIDTDEPVWRPCADHSTKLQLYYRDGDCWIDHDEVIIDPTGVNDEIGRELVLGAVLLLDDVHWRLDADEIWWLTQIEKIEASCNRRVRVNERWHDVSTTPADRCLSRIEVTMSVAPDSLGVLDHRWPPEVEILGERMQVEIGEAP